ncbi:hypothetical protein MSAN_01498400 [Mycena sanguinolenta]|uniref:Uncharacterized protein n=1 Tax=Mycena sanguinolenta TaxID=230812 RepID=A0A8H7CZ01_9AGAR|nr:hypothetical protein MSAN_01498400 [Mycena sanguinolenta]
MIDSVFTPLILDLPRCRHVGQSLWTRLLFASCFSPSSSMDPQADSDEEFIVLSTSDYTETASNPGAPFPQAGRLKSSAELFVKSIGFLPSLLRARGTEFQAPARTHTRKYSETMGRQIVDQRSITNYYINDFRTIQRGDLKLVKEVRLSTESGVVSRQSRGVSVRRAVYHAEIRGDPGTVTVAVYQGNGAEEEWRKDVVKYESIWDPHIMQLYGLVSTKGLYAMVFHDELIPYAQFFRRFQHSPILSTYIIGYCPITKRGDSLYFRCIPEALSRLYAYALLGCGSPAAYESCHRLRSISAAAYSAPHPHRARARPHAGENDENELVVPMAVDTDAAPRSMYAPHAGYPNHASSRRAASSALHPGAAVPTAVDVIRIFFADDVPVARRGALYRFALRRRAGIRVQRRGGERRNANLGIWGLSRGCTSPTPFAFGFAFAFSFRLAETTGGTGNGAWTCT